MVDSHRAVEEPVPGKTPSPPRVTPESVAAFARWSAAAAKHFRDRHVIWEIYNAEPNGQFWRPKPDVTEYTNNGASNRGRRSKKPEPNATVIGPALSAFDFKFLEPFLASGVLQYLDGVSVHPYRQPTKTSRDSRSWLQANSRHDQSLRPRSPIRDKIAIISGEWGYTSKNKRRLARSSGRFRCPPAARQPA